MWLSEIQGGDKDVLNWNYTWSDKKRLKWDDLKLYKKFDNIVREQLLFYWSTILDTNSGENW